MKCPIDIGRRLLPCTGLTSWLKGADTSRTQADWWSWEFTHTWSAHNSGLKHFPFSTQVPVKSVSSFPLHSSLIYNWSEWLTQNNVQTQTWAVQASLSEQTKLQTQVQCAMHSLTYIPSLLCFYVSINWRQQVNHCNDLFNSECLQTIGKLNSSLSSMAAARREIPVCNLSRPNIYDFIELKWCLVGNSWAEFIWRLSQYLEWAAQTDVISI